MNPKICRDCEKEYIPKAGNQNRCPLCARLVKELRSVQHHSNKKMFRVKNTGWSVDDISWGGK